MTNEEELREWLNAQSQETCVDIAYRAAMRVLPLAAVLDGSKARRDLALASLRATITGGLAVRYADTSDSEELRRAGGRSASAAKEADKVAKTAFKLVRPAAKAARSTAYAVASTHVGASSVAAFAAIKAAASCTRSTDGFMDAYDDVVHCAQLSMDRAINRSDGFGSLVSQSGEQPNALSGANEWSFWVRWYKAAMAGKPLDWELQKQIALIPEEIWEAGPEAVAAEIARIELGFKTDVLPRLVRKDGDSVFEVETDALPPQEVADFICTRIEISYRVALESAGANGFDESSPEAIEIAGTLAAQNRSNSVLATGFWAACLSFNERIGDIYPEDTSLINLKNSLFGAVDELCELDPIAKARCGRMAALVVERRVDDEDRAMAEDVPEIVSEHVSDEAKIIIESDVERILTEANPPKTVRARFTNWMTTISIWMDRGMKADKKAKWLADLVDRLQGWWGGPPV